MDEATATTRLKSMLAWDQEPTLTIDQILVLVASARRMDSSFRWTTDFPEIARSTAYALGDVRAPAFRAGYVNSGHIYTVTTAGTTAASTPTFPTSGTVTDGSVVWTETGLAWSGTYDLNAAAAEGWRWKAATVAGQFDFQTDQQTFDRTGKYKQCMAMAEHYQKRVSGNIRVGPALPVLPSPIIPIPADDFTI